MPIMRRRRNPRRYSQIVTETKQVSFDTTKQIPDLTQYFNDNDEQFGWYIVQEIICPPIVVLVLCRDREVEEENPQDERPN